jgi:two-component system, LytTR family, response regulator LytT
MNVLIIEDEPRAAQKISDFLAEIDQTIRVVERLDSVEQTIKWFGTHDAPNLIFSDIQLTDGLCFDIFREIEVKSPIVFCTAYDEYLINAFDTNAVSYLLKPVTKELLEKSLEKFRTLQQVFNDEQNRHIMDKILTHISDAQQYKSSIIVNQGEKIIPIKTDKIAFIQLGSHGVCITTHSHETFLYYSSMDNLEKQLNPVQFFRANRQFLINRNAIANIERFFNRKLVVKLQIPTSEKILVSKLKASDFIKWLEQ